MEFFLELLMILGAISPLIGGFFYMMKWLNVVLSNHRKALERIQLLECDRDAYKHEFSAINTELKDVKFILVKLCGKLDVDIERLFN